MKYLCVECNYIYDESLWDPSEWIEPWTKIEDFIKCPVCDEYDSFHHINEEVIYIDDNTPDRIELEHDIHVNNDNNSVEVTIWNNQHPMTSDHRITWVWLYDEYSDLVDQKFLWVDDDSVVVFDNYDLDEFEVRVKCSQHKLFAKKFNI